MANVKMEGLGKIYPNGVEAVRDFSLEIQDRQFVVLAGPSGCGKSTMLRMIAGLESITSGRLLIDGKEVNQLRPKVRDIAMVFQNYALYPHMTIYKNMEIGLRMRQVDPKEIRRKIQRTARMLDIEQLLDRKPGKLSGGQQQRAALGRAIVRNPSVFLMDEPLSNLDAKLRNQMRVRIIELHKELKATFVYVTHDQTEAMTMADRIVVMDQGLIQQADTPRNLYDRPRNLFTAGFIGTPQMNFFDCRLEKTKDGWLTRWAGGQVPLPGSRFAPEELNQYLDRPMVLGARCEDIKIGRGDSLARLELEENIGSDCYLHLQAAGQPFVTKISAQQPIPDPEHLTFSLDQEKIHLFDKESGMAVKIK